jgi:hypothetical protein
MGLFNRIGDEATSGEVAFCGGVAEGWKPGGGTGNRV